MIWRREMTLEQLNVRSQKNMAAHLGIQFTALNESSLEATMPVDHRTMQPLGLLHGGASVVLAESLASAAGYLCSQDEQQVVGIEINANHLRSVRSGTVRAICRPLHLGRRNQVWQIEIFDQQERLICSSRLTTAVLDKIRDKKTSTQEEGEIKEKP